MAPRGSRPALKPVVLAGCQYCKTGPRGTGPHPWPNHLQPRGAVTRDAVTLPEARELGGSQPRERQVRRQSKVTPAGPGLLLISTDPVLISDPSNWPYKHFFGGGVQVRYILAPPPTGDSGFLPGDTAPRTAEAWRACEEAWDEASSGGACGPAFGRPGFKETMG